MILMFNYCISDMSNKKGGIMAVRSKSTRAHKKDPGKKKHSHTSHLEKHEEKHHLRSHSSRDFGAEMRSMGSK
jgi:hypothetical protein